MNFDLCFENGHLFVLIQNTKWLLDTGGPGSFGNIPELTLDGQQFQIPNKYGGFTVEELNGYIHAQAAGLLGSDILNQFDTIIDLPHKTIKFSAAELDFQGEECPITGQTQGVPIISGTVDGQDIQMYFDTGAKVSYLENFNLEGYPRVNTDQDFYPGFGNFEVEVFSVPVRVANIDFNLRCGRLPGAIRGLLQGRVTGILGDQFLLDRTVGYFPRRDMIRVGA